LHVETPSTVIVPADAPTPSDVDGDADEMTLLTPVDVERRGSIAVRLSTFSTPPRDSFTTAADDDCLVPGRVASNGAEACGVEMGHYRDLTPVSFDHPDPFHASPSLHARASAYYSDDIDPLCTPSPLDARARARAHARVPADIHSPRIAVAPATPSPLRRLATSMSELHLPLPRAFRVLLPSEVHRLSEPAWSPQGSPRSADVGAGEETAERRPRRSFGDLLRGRPGPVQVQMPRPVLPVRGSSLAWDEESFGCVDAVIEERRRDTLVAPPDLPVSVPRRGKGGGRLMGSFGGTLRRKMSTALGLGPRVGKKREAEVAESSE
jgi:hypothetical protein